MKAHYFVLGYDRSTSPELKLKIEPTYRNFTRYRSWK